MGEAGSFAEDPGMKQSLTHTQALMRVEDDQLTDLQETETSSDPDRGVQNLDQRSRRFWTVLLYQMLTGYFKSRFNLYHDWIKISTTI